VHGFQPREVEWNAPWRWAREALALIARRPYAFGLASLAGLLLFFAALQVDHVWLRFAIVLLLPPLTLAGMVRLAEAADRSLELPWIRLLPTNAEALQVLGLAALGYGLAFAAIVAAGGGPDGLEPGAAEAAQQWRDHLEAAVAAAGLPLSWVIKAVLFGASVAAFCGLSLTLFAWFTLPLTQSGGVPLPLAIRLSFTAYRLNAHRLGLTSLALLAAAFGLVLLSFGLAALLIAPFAGALMYVSYRDVFLGRTENAPALARESVFAAAEA